jgi:hypothetical protein
MLLNRLEDNIMADDFDALLDEAENMTLKQLDSRISSLVSLKDSELKSLFPTKPDKEKLIQLMQIVKGAEEDNIKQKNLIDNISSLAGTVLTLVRKLA